MNLDLTALNATLDYAQPRELPDTYPKGRVCIEEGCITRLSSYNEGPWCYCHATRHLVELATYEERRSLALDQALDALPPAVKRAAAMRDEGYTLRDAAPLLAVSHEMVRRYLQQYDEAMAEAGR